MTKQSKSLRTLMAAAVFVAGSLVAVAPALAQPQNGQPGGGPCVERGRRGGDPAAHLERRLTRLTEVLQLDARQVSRVRAILQESAQRRQAVRALPRGSDQKRQARADLRTWTHARIRAVLTAAQQTRFDQLRAERRERGRHGPDGRGGRRHRGGRTEGDV